MTDKVREVFEAWYREKYPRTASQWGKFERDQLGEYADAGVFIGFSAWQAQQERIDELERQVESLRIANKIQLGARADCGRCADLERRLKEAEKESDTWQELAVVSVWGRGQIDFGKQLHEALEACKPYIMPRIDAAIEQGKDKP
jgi:hypothetical protein